MRSLARALARLRAWWRSRRRRQHARAERRHRVAFDRLYADANRACSHAEPCADCQRRRAVAETLLAAAGRCPRSNRSRSAAGGW